MRTEPTVTEPAGSQLVRTSGTNSPGAANRSGQFGLAPNGRSLTPIRGVHNGSLSISCWHSYARPEQSSGSSQPPRELRARRGRKTSALSDYSLRTSNSRASPDGRRSTSRAGSIDRDMQEIKRRYVPTMIFGQRVAEHAANPDYPHVRDSGHPTFGVTIQKSGQRLRARRKTIDAMCRGS